jgi:hypothetical protein
MALVAMQGLQLDLHDVFLTGHCVGLCVYDGCIDVFCIRNTKGNLTCNTQPVITAYEIKRAVAKCKTAIRHSTTTQVKQFVQNAYTCTLQHLSL